MFSRSVVTLVPVSFTVSVCHVQSFSRHFSPRVIYSVSLSCSVVTLVPVSFTVSGWLLPLLALGLLPGVVCGQNIYNFSLAPGQSQTLLAAPGDITVLPVDVVWDERDVDNVEGVLDGVHPYSYDSFTQATNFTEGTAHFTLDPSGMTEGR